MANTKCRFKGKAPATQEATESKWSELIADMIQNISKMLHDIADFISFRALNQRWLTDTSISDLPPQIPWLLEQPDPTSGVLRFYSLFSDKVRTVQCPQSRGKWLAGPSHGYLFTANWEDQKHSLLNPLTKDEVTIPFTRPLVRGRMICMGPDPIKNDYIVFMGYLENDQGNNMDDLDNDQANDMDDLENDQATDMADLGIDQVNDIDDLNNDHANDMDDLDNDHANDMDDLDDDHANDMAEEWPMMMGFYRPLSQEWDHFVVHFNNVVTSQACLKGSLYVREAETGATRVIDIANRSSRIIPAPPHETFNFGDQVYFVESGEKILRIDKKTDPSLVHSIIFFDIYELDLEGENGQARWVKVRGIGDQVLFLDNCTGISVTASKSTRLKGNGIYWLESIADRSVVVPSSVAQRYKIEAIRYNIENGRTERTRCPFDRSLTWMVPSVVGSLSNGPH